MKKRQLGTSDLYITEIGLGCMSIGTNEREATNILHTAIDSGLNYIDTADLYDFGLNETFVGKALKGKRREQVIVATKVGNRWTEKKDGWKWDPSKSYILKAVKDSLYRLGTDYIDLYQLHGGTIDDPIDETIEAFEQLKKEGIIRYYGISSIRPNVIREYAKHSNIVSVLMEYSMLNRRPEELFPLLQEHNISVIARGPVAKGLLTDHNERKIEQTKTKDYLSYSYNELVATIEKIKKTTPNRPLSETAIQFCLHNPIIASVIPGASTKQQLQENVKASEAQQLSDDDYKNLIAILKKDVYTLHR